MNNLSEFLESCEYIYHHATPEMLDICKNFVYEVMAMTLILDVSHEKNPALADFFEIRLAAYTYH